MSETIPNPRYVTELERIRSAYKACIDFAEERLDIEKAGKVANAFNKEAMSYMLTPMSPEDIEVTPVKDFKESPPMTREQRNKLRKQLRQEPRQILLIDYLKPTATGVEVGRRSLEYMYDKLREYVPAEEIASKLSSAGDVRSRE